MKYFFLADGWSVGRVWESSGLWDDISWRRRPTIERLGLCVLEQEETFWLYRVEDAVLMVEVKVTAALAQSNPNARAIGQVVLKRLISAEQVLDRLSAAQAICQPKQGVEL